jgi:hypothetical protein
MKRQKRGRGVGGRDGLEICLTFELMRGIVQLPIDMDRGGWPVDLRKLIIEQIYINSECAVFRSSKILYRGSGVISTPPPPAYMKSCYIYRTAKNIRLRDRKYGMYLYKIKKIKNLLTKFLNFNSKTVLMISFMIVINKYYLKTVQVDY